MANLIFKKRKGVINAPLSLIAYDGDISDIHLALQEYIIICGDIGSNNRDETLRKLRDEMSMAGHVLEIQDTDP